MFKDVIMPLIVLVLVSFVLAVALTYAMAVVLPLIFGDGCCPPNFEFG